MLKIFMQQVKPGTHVVMLGTLSQAGIMSNQAFNTSSQAGNKGSQVGTCQDIQLTYQEHVKSTSQNVK